MEQHPLDMALIRNAAFPEGDKGRQMIEKMNLSHESLTRWAFEPLTFGDTILDIGCGGGAALLHLALRFPRAKLYGCDPSPLAVESARTLNRNALETKRMEILQSGVSSLPFSDDFFATIFSIESYYFWPEPARDFKEICRVLRPGGSFMVALEMVGGTMSETHQEIARQLKMNCPTPSELEQTFLEAGFAVTSLLYHPENRWLCGIGTKPAEPPCRTRATI